MTRRSSRSRLIRWRVVLSAMATAICLLIGGFGLMRPLPNSCIMTYMYPTYVPVPAAPDSSSGKYGLFKYHEGWKKIDNEQHLQSLSGVPVLFIPGNGGSYKQVRSLAAESDRAYNGGPLDRTYYRESFFTPEEAGMSSEGWWGHEKYEDSRDRFRDILEYTERREEYVNRLDWFAVDLEGEHSALDGRILEEHTEYVVQAIHRILDHYKSLKTNVLPTSVILVGHSMGGVVARAAVVHSKLRKGAVQTVITVSAPHLIAPLALQPSLGHFFSRINDLWRTGYESSKTRLGRPKEAPLSNVVVISIPGGIHDYQVRSRMASLEGIVPATHSLTVGAPGVLNAWLSTEHQTILWCNQLVVQLAHTLLKIVDKETAQALSNPRARLATFVASLRSALPHTFGWLPTADDDLALDDKTTKDGQARAVSDVSRFSCSKSIQWESNERDLNIESSSVTVLAMDGRRRWLDIKKQADSGKTDFILVTNLIPCSGVRIHLWREKSRSSKRAVEVTRKMVQLPAGPAPRQMEPGGQSEQAPPSGILRLNTRDLEGFRYITISVAPRPTVAGRPPPAISMAVGHFFNSKDGIISLSPLWILSSLFRKQDVHLEENHPLVMNFSVSIGLGVLPLFWEVKTATCGVSEAKPNTDIASLCKLRCFQPIALLWEPYSGLQVIPNLRAQTLTSDSSAVLAGYRYGSEDTSMILLVDPHCGYNVSFKVAKIATIQRFILTHGAQIGAFMVAVLLFALARQAYSGEHERIYPSLYACLEHNLVFPFPFLGLCFGPLLVYFAGIAFGGGFPPPYVLSLFVAFVCYTLANGVAALLTLGSMVTFHASAALQVFMQSRWRSWLERWNNRSLQRFFTQLSMCINLQMVKKMRAMPRLTLGVVATVLVFFVHPALGLGVMLLSHAWSCHVALCRYREVKKLNGVKPHENGLRNGPKLEVNSKDDDKFAYMDVFRVSQGLLLLHFSAMAMLLPSFVAWIQRPKVEKSLPWLMDSVLSFGVILHGLYAMHETTSTNTKSHLRLGLRLSFMYAVAGMYTYWGGLVLAPYKAFYALAAIGLLASALRFISNKNHGDGCNRRHFHRH